MDRRTYLRQMALVAGGIVIAPRILVSCKDQLKQIDLSSSLEPFRTLEEIQHFVRLSKGHLSCEVDRLIKNKDAEEIYRFIDTRIVTIPGHPQSITSNAYEVRWGQNGMLRCGKGTLREKSDLLFFMLTEAGFNPTYHRANFPMSPELVQKVFCRKWENNNVIEVDEAYLDKWDEVLEPTEKDPVVQSIDDSGNQSKKLAEELMKALPEIVEENLPHIDWLDIDGLEAPIVRMEENGKIKDLNFVEVKEYSAFTESEYSLYSLSADDANKQFDKLRVIVNATFSNALNEPKEIARGEWPLEELLGNQVAFQCVSTIPQEALLQTPIKDIHQFVPILSLQNSEHSKEKQKEQSFKGVGFDLMGNTFEEDGDGIIRMNGVKMEDVAQSDVREVKSLKIQLLDHEYPTIKLKCAPLDAEGKPVVGLTGAAFEITDQKKRQFPVVLQNTITTKVLVFFDASSSMPYPYGASEIPTETMDVIRHEFEKKYPSVIIDTQGYLLEFIQDLERLELREYDHILCIGDGEAFEDVTSEQLTEVVGEGSISYHYVLNGSSGQTKKSAERVFAGAGFSFFEMNNLEDDLAQVCDVLDKSLRFPYLMTYEAPYEGDDMIHPVTIALNGNNQVPKVKKRYVVDRERNYKDGVHPCAMSITLEWDTGYSRQSITKHVVGYNEQVDQEVRPEHKEAVRSFALGTHRFLFEPDKTTLPILLDESIASQLSVAPFFEDPKEEMEEQLEQINQFQVRSNAAASVFAPLPEAGQDWITFENSFQTCFYSEFVDFNQQRMVKKVDMWDTSDVRTFATSKREAFVKNLEATALLAFSEHGLFRESTFSLLEGKSVICYKDGDIDFEKHPEWYSLYTHAYRNHLIYDSSFSTAAYWKINKSTGAVLGMLPDGSGGGIEAQIAHNLKIIDSYAGAYNKMATPLMSDPLAFGTVTLYGQFLARLYGLVCVAVLSMDAAKLPADSRQAIKKLAYGVIKSFAFAKFGKLKQFEKILDKLFDPGWPKMKK